MRYERIESRRLPGGDLVSALFDREVMGLADRGGGSNLIGDRWADLAADYAASWQGTERRIHADDREPSRIVRVDRLDATPRIAAIASKRGLQNPDLVLIANRRGRQVLQAADAKFSVETARAKQVSPDVVRGLLELREVLPELLPGIDEAAVVEQGVFLSPDYPLTHLMLRRRHGIVRTTVRPEEVVFVPVDPASFWDGVAGASVMDPLADTDDLPTTPSQSLMAGVYYFRLARAAVGLWLDATKPLLLHNDAIAVDEEAVRREAKARSRGARSAIEVIRRWDSDVQVVRDQRAAVDQVAALPIPGRELRPMAARIAAAAGGDPPSANQVRRRLGAWYRGELRQRLGPIQPPVADLRAVLERIAAAGRQIAPSAEREFERIVLELMAEKDPSGGAVDAAYSSRSAGERNP